MYCCTGFRNLLSCVGERGHAVIACEVSPGQVRFLLQSRGLAFGDEKKWKPVPIDVKINVSAEIGLQFCPFCGRKLEELVHESPEFFNNLAKEHAKFLTSMPKL
jgi:hypothetical protein